VLVETTRLNPPVVNIHTGVVGSAPPVSHGGDVAGAVAAEDVVCPGETVTYEVY
jgi:hypothetical protein